MAKYGVVIILNCLLFIEALEVHSLIEKDEYGIIECILPPYPSNAKWKYGDGAKPGDKVSEANIVELRCVNGSKLTSGSVILYCDENWNSLEFPECEELCPPLPSSPTYELSCRDKRGQETNCSEATNGTFFKYTCAPFYETPFGYNKTSLCQNGRWDQKPVCQPVCGKKIVKKSNPLISGSKPNEQPENPWVAALYRKIDGSYDIICGGTILSASVVLTAAHCVTNEYGDVYAAENHAVGVGKLYNKYKAPEDKHAQYLQISKIFVSKNYEGPARNYLADIAVLVTDGKFIFNEAIQPVCFNNVNNIPLRPQSIGEISGWGLTKGDLLSEVLRTVKTLYKNESSCAKEFPKDWAAKYHLDDKLCAGYVGENASVCQGYGGAGLVFQNPNDKRYYIHGILSLKPQTGSRSDIQQNNLYTKVGYYYCFVDTLMSVLSRYNLVA